jgi:23S rRNA pseudouridine955/2504/2580 synthase
MFLHAHRVRFTHPLTGADVVIESPMPPELARFVARLDADQNAMADA